jgi:hypothetical protein
MCTDFEHCLNPAPAEANRIGQIKKTNSRARLDCALQLPYLPRPERPAAAAEDSGVAQVTRPPPAPAVRETGARGMQARLHVLRSAARRLSSWPAPSRRPRPPSPPGPTRFRNSFQSRAEPRFSQNTRYALYAAAGLLPAGYCAAHLDRAPVCFHSSLVLALARGARHGVAVLQPLEFTRC